MDWSAALPTFVITLREGVEAALVVGIVLAYLRQADRTELNPSVWWGIAAGIGASGLVGWGFNRVLAQLATSTAPIATVIEPLMEASFGLIAIALLSWMLIWMTKQAKGLKGEIESNLNQVLSQSSAASWGIFTLIAIAVLREGFETVVFISAQFQAGLMPVIGAMAGLIGAVAIGIALFALGIRINLRLFFQGMGLFLLLIVAGLVVGLLHHLDEAAIAWSSLNPNIWLNCPVDTESCLLGTPIWDLQAYVPERRFPGILLKALFGYRDHLYLAQVIGYTIFLSVVGGLYFQSLGWRQGDRDRTKP